jgi:hypothetical protein
MSKESYRLYYAKKRLKDLNIEIVFESDNRIDFMHNGKTCSIYPYTGFFTGPTIKDGRGVEKLIEQLI